MSLVVPQRVDGKVTVECSVCGMALWTPVARLDVSVVGLYDDARFPGRCILMIDRHFENLDEVDADLAAKAFEDVRVLSRAIKATTGVERVNYAVLGNAEPHVHWHLIPRKPMAEPLPNRSPWNDPRQHTKLDAADRDALVAALRDWLLMHANTVSAL